MIIRETHISECWCPQCASGQMAQIHDILMKEKTSVSKLMRRKITCENCGVENEITDVLELIPTSYLVSSVNEISKVKSNNELMNWLNSDEGKQKNDRSS